MDSDKDSDDLNGGGDDISSVEDDSESETSEEVLYTEDRFIRDLPRVRNNDPNIKVLGIGNYDFIQNITNEEWERIGRDISNNTILKTLELNYSALNDDKMSCLFRGLTRSTSLERLSLYSKDFSIAGVRCLVSFLQHEINLQLLDLDCINIQSEGFNMLLRALRDSSIVEIQCRQCGIDINTENFPQKLQALGLSRNNINADGYREVAKLLQGGDSTLTRLELKRCGIDDEGVSILVDALRNNTSLRILQLWENDGISKEGLVMLLKLVNDISSVTATLQSNHSVFCIHLDLLDDIHPKENFSECDEAKLQINMATRINMENVNSPEAAGRDKVIQTQLHSLNRATLAKLQGVSHSVYSEINPLHLPEVLSLVGRRHGQGELYVALKSSIAGVISSVNKRQHLEQLIAYHAAKLAQHRAELAQLDAAVDQRQVGNEACSNKRHRSR